MAILEQEKLGGQTGREDGKLYMNSDYNRPSLISRITLPGSEQIVVWGPRVWKNAFESCHSTGPRNPRHLGSWRRLFNCGVRVAPEGED